MCMTDGDGQTIRSIDLQCRDDLQQGSDHDLYLFLVSGARTRYHLFDEPRGVFCHHQLARYSSGNGRAASLPQFQGGHRVVAQEYLLDGHFLRLPLGDDVAERSMDMPELFGE